MTIASCRNESKINVRAQEYGHQLLLDLVRGGRVSDCDKARDGNDACYLPLRDVREIALRSALSCKLEPCHVRIYVNRQAIHDRNGPVFDLLNPEPIGFVLYGRVSAIVQLDAERTDAELVEVVAFESFIEKADWMQLALE